MRETLIRELYNGGLGGHFGIDKTKVFGEDKYYWIRFSVDVKNWIQ